MKGDVIPDQFSILWFQKDSLDTAGLGLLGLLGGRWRWGGGPRALNKIVDFRGPKSDRES